MKKLFVAVQISIQALLVLTVLYGGFIFIEPNTFPVSYTAAYLFDPPPSDVLHTRELQEPVLLTIPRIGVQASIEPVGLVTGGGGEMATPSNFTNVAWYQDGVIPGAAGSAVIAGHLNGRNVPQAVFYNLEKLVVGDTLVVTNKDATTVTFSVTAVKTFSYSDPTDEIFFSNDSIARLNLITCSGTWLSEVGLYDKRTVVFSQRVDPPPIID